MAQKPSIPKGTRDFSPMEMSKRNYIFDTIKEVYQLYGFQQIETPAMETLGTLMKVYKNRYFLSKKFAETEIIPIFASAFRRNQHPVR